MRAARRPAKAVAVSTSRADAAERRRLVAALRAELTRARVRGLDRLERDPGQQHAVATPELDRLARIYTGDDTGGRVARIRRLLDDALVAWQRHASDADTRFVRGLYFNPERQTPGPDRPTDLLAAVQTDSGLSDETFPKHRRALVRQFATYLPDFALGEQPPLRLASPSPALLAVERWSLADLACVVATAVLTVVMVITPGGPGGQGSAGGSAAATGVAFRFDDLGGGSKVINVYPGVTDFPADKAPNGTFTDGRTATALCTTTGRLVTSDPSAGERPRQSDVWLKVLAQPGKTSYAVLTYGDIDQAALKALPSC
jgi:hypothetical protein